MSKPLVPTSFVVPDSLKLDGFYIRMLSVNDVVKDYDAVMTSIDHLQGIFGERSNWPTRELTLEQDLIDLGWHQKEFQKRTSFAYTVVNSDDSQCLGCMYIYPSSNDNVEAEVYCWVRQSEYDKGLDKVLFDTVKVWIREKWPFTKVRYPGRD